MASPTQWHGFGWAPGVGDGQGDLAYCSSWGCKELDMPEWLNWTELRPALLKKSFFSLLPTTILSCECSVKVHEEKPLREHNFLWIYITQNLPALSLTQNSPFSNFQIGKGVCQGCILSPWLFNLYAEFIMRNARLDEAQDGIKTAGRNINNFRYSDDTTLWQKAKN